MRANVICPRARTPMTAGVFGPAPDGPGVDALSVDHVTPFVTYLASPAADRVNGQVFVVYGGRLMHLAPPTVAHRFVAPDGIWTPEALEDSLGPYFADRPADDVFSCDDLRDP